jgi:murein DD-endopeptidase MepM/ murein hydrolase activator NlpD
VHFTSFRFSAIFSVFLISSCGFMSAPPPIHFSNEWNGKTVWANRSMEELNPTWIENDSMHVDIRPGEKWFKTVLDSGMAYSIIVDAGALDACDPSVDGTRMDCQAFELAGRRSRTALDNGAFEHRAYGFEGSLHGVEKNYSPAKTALIFDHDGGTEFFYFRVRNTASVSLPATVRILRFEKKHFGHPLASRPAASGAVAYFNLFRHRTRLYRGLTRNGHDGIDLAVDFNTHHLPHDVIQEVVAVADGVVLKAHMESCAIGHIVWVRHDTPFGVMTSMYAHMSSFVVRPGQKVKKGERLGFIIEEPLCDFGYSGHLHFEMWNGISTAWHDGYSSGNGQIDPLPWIFEK